MEEKRKLNVNEAGGGRMGDDENREEIEFICPWHGVIYTLNYCPLCRAGMR